MNSTNILAGIVNNKKGEYFPSAYRLQPPISSYYLLPASFFQRCNNTRIIILNGFHLLFPKTCLLMNLISIIYKILRCTAPLSSTTNIYLQILWCSAPFSLQYNNLHQIVRSSAFLRPKTKQQSCKIFVGIHLKHITIGAEHRNRINCGFQKLFLKSVLNRKDTKKGTKNSLLAISGLKYTNL